MDVIIDGFHNLMEVSEFQTLFKLVLIAILAGIIGYERESWKKPAGFRTYVLVGISAVLVMICGDLLYEELGADPTRIPAQLLSGIGFIGAGTISFICAFFEKEQKTAAERFCSAAWIFITYLSL